MSVLVWLCVLLLELPSLGAVGQANLKADLVPHAQRVRRVALLAAPPAQDTRHARRGQVLDVREHRAAPVDSRVRELHEARQHSGDGARA